MVDGLAFTTIGVPDLGVGEFIRYRVEPSVLQLAVCLQANLDSWQRLDPRARALLEAEAVRYERGNRARFAALEAREHAALAAGGLQTIRLPPAAADAYVALARETTWQRLAARAPASARVLRPLFDPPGPAAPAAAPPP
jgi:TRAP-type C4-dicarboxylate transport system substrate-binding protein